MFNRPYFSHVPRLMILVPMFPVFPSPYIPRNVPSPVAPLTCITQSLFANVPMFPVVARPYFLQSLFLQTRCSPVPLFHSPFKPQSRCSPDVFACPYIPTNIHLIPPVHILSDCVAQSLCRPPPPPPPPPHTHTHTHTHHHHHHHHTTTTTTTTSSPYVPQTGSPSPDVPQTYFSAPVSLRYVHHSRCSPAPMVP